jgi:hypothetical protein
MEIDRRFLFSGDATGVAAHFHRLDDLDKLDHVIPTLGSSAIPPTGGRSHHQLSNQKFFADRPRRRLLVSADHAEALAIGHCEDEANFKSEIHAFVRSLSILEQLHLDLVEVHQVTTRNWYASSSHTETKGEIKGLRLGNVKVHVELDDAPFSKCSTKQELREFYASQSEDYRRENSHRFHTPPGAAEITERNGRCFGSLVKKIELDGPEDEKRKIHVDGYSIKWDGFGRIFLGEVIASDKDRRVSMIRLKMGSSAAGTATIGGGQTNGSTVP